MKAKTFQSKDGGQSMITVVNPIYDGVFKYLMEDERIAKTLLTALLKKEVLSVFDQIHRQPGDKKYINLDESKYEGDEEMMRIIQRLTAATVTADVREEMQVEDEYFSAIENRDTELMEQKKLLEKKDNEIAENKAQLEKKDNEIAQKDNNLNSAAKYMLDCCLDVSKIMQATGLTQEQINSLKNQA